MFRDTRTSLDALQEATIDDDWHMEGDKSKSESWIGETRLALLNNNPPEGYMWVQGRLRRKQATTRPGMSARDQRGIYCIPDSDLGHEVIIDNAKRKHEIRRASAMPCKVATPANPNGSSWRRPCASEWSKKETKKAKLQGRNDDFSDTSEL